MKRYFPRPAPKRRDPDHGAEVAARLRELAAAPEAIPGVAQVLQQAAESLDAASELGKFEVAMACRRRLFDALQAVPAARRDSQWLIEVRERAATLPRLVCGRNGTKTIGGST